MSVLAGPANPGAGMSAGLTPADEPGRRGSPGSGGARAAGSPGGGSPGGPAAPGSGCHLVGYPGCRQAGGRRRAGWES